MDERQKISFTSFGSRIINYSWFVALENANNEQLFRSDSHLMRLGFIAEQKNLFNPDSLPIGITRDFDADGNSWAGLTCAACHTGQLNINGELVRIDGGQSLIDYGQFEIELLAALKATDSQPEKWLRFIARLHQTQKNSDPVSVKFQLRKRIEDLEIRFAINAVEVPYGYGRLDAFGQIFNAVAVEALQISENKRAPNAPTSFPVMWDASHLDVVQWNGSAPNKEPGPLAQNATTALAVYGTVDVMGHAHSYPSSTQIKNLGYLQSKFYQLTSPRWPENIAGKINSSLKDQGEKIYRLECIQCHSLVDSTDPKRQLSAVLIPVNQVGTDSLVVDNFSEGHVKTGELEGKKFAMWVGKKFATEASRLDIVMHVTLGSLLHHPWDSLCSLVKEFAINKTTDVDSTINYYKARPINGVWSSAPYLHNGSVPTIYDLLLPAAQRPVQFYVGNRELDPVKIGNDIAQVDSSGSFDTTQLGNSNAGHEYGTGLKESEKMALLEYIKSL